MLTATAVTTSPADMPWWVGVIAIAVAFTPLASTYAHDRIEAYFDRKAGRPGRVHTDL